MKKGTYIFASITLAFITLLIGIQLGRNMNDADVTIRMSAESSTRPLNTAEATVGSNDTKQPAYSVAGKKMNINTATAEELDALPGIGPVIAQRIIDYRQKNGGFTSVSELLNVKGIGEKKYSEIMELITTEDD